MKHIVLGLGVMLAAATPAQAEQLVGLVGGNSIVRFDSATPGTIIGSNAISGLGNDTLLGIDLRPTDRNIYGLGQSGTVYRLGTGSGGITAFSLGTLSTALNGGNADIDFNPAANRLRISTNANQSLRVNLTVNPITTTTDGSFAYTSGDAPSVVGVAYRNNRPGATTTTFYALDAARNQLNTVNPPNVGTLTSPVAINGLTLTAGGPTGFDISGGTGTAFVAFGGNLYTLGLGSGQANLIGGFGAGVTDITSLSVPEPATWAMMIGGFGFVGASLRRRSGLQLKAAKSVQA